MNFYTDENASVRLLLQRFEVLRSALAPTGGQFNVTLYFGSEAGTRLPAGELRLPSRTKIETIKIVRDVFKTGLLEAKRVVDAVERERLTVSTRLFDGTTALRIEWVP